VAGRKLRRLVGPAIAVVGLAAFVVITIAPLAWLVISSLMEQQALTSKPPNFSGGSFTLANYTGVFAAAAQLGQGFANSFLVALFTTAVAIAVGAPAAYALARLSIPGANTILLMVLGTQMLPGIVIAIPLFIVMSDLGLVDTRLALFIVYLSFNLPIVIWILRGFFLAIPRGSSERPRSTGPRRRRSSG
jgi:multiple sugar transport system permease protein